ncbi:DarT1-associated NADAR antitoxin family protein [Shewanella oncorhynchi]|uniref:DarT1-associated NADAR antitoxin family protein n=1 Tax=Shewanella oncorhynchi TaxID=2726434 RepID=UPI003D7AB4C6
MAIRPIFIPIFERVGVLEKPVEFKWHAGMAPSQKKKSIIELHLRAADLGVSHILEISSKSEVSLGINLSAFNLTITTQKYARSLTVETAFQGSKVFEKGGPFRDLFGLDSYLAKKDIRLKESGNLKKFKFFSFTFPLIPRTYFYDWLYINALMQHENLRDELSEYKAFSDIEFNPKKSINCQAHAVALYLSLKGNNLLKQALESPDAFLDVCREHYENQSRNVGVQASIF